MIYRFGDATLDDEAFTLNVGKTQRHVEPLVFDLIVYLTKNAGRVLSRDELIDHVWAGRIVSDTTITSCIKSARRAVGDDGSKQEIIRTVRGRGFQFVAHVTPSGSGDAGSVAVVESTKEHEPEISQDAVPDKRPSIAVLPLHLLTAQSTHPTLGDAVSQEVILELSRLHWLFVIARGSSFAFRDPNVDLRNVSARLGVRYILSGTLAVHEQQSIVTVELSHGADGRIIWAERFEQPLGDLLFVKSTIAANIVAAVEKRIETTEAIRAGRLSTENLDAWSAYHSGLWHMFRFTEADNTAAHAMFVRALEDDPHFARAHAGLSFTHFQNAFLNFSSDRREERRRARVAAEKSHDLDPHDPFVNLTMARSKWIDGDLDGAMPWLQRSIDLSPNYAFAIYNNALLGVLRGEGEASADQVSKAISLSPIDPLNYAMLCTRAMSHLMRGDTEEACLWAGRAIRAPNAHFQIYVFAAIAYEKGGRRAAAEQSLTTARQLKPDLTSSDFFKAFPFVDGAFRKEIGESLRRLGVQN